MAEDSIFTPLRKSIKRKNTGEEDNLMSSYGDEPDREREPANSSELTEKEVHNIRYNNSIEVDAEDCPKPMRSFKEANLPENIMNFLANSRILAPTPVQMQTIPIMISGRDLITIAPTGSGKTLSYLLPLFTFLMRRADRTSLKPGCPIALIVTPTRELMQQVCTVTKTVIDSIHLMGTTDYNIGSSYYKNEGYHQEIPKRFVQNISLLQHNYKHGWLNNTNFSHLQPYNFNHPMYPNNQNRQEHNKRKYSVLGICGGQPLNVQVEQLRDIVDIIVATPGRLLELSEKKFVNLDSVSYFVLDECDKMLDMGLEEQLRKLIAIVTIFDIPRQTSLWSATLPSSLERLARTAVLNPITVYVGSKDTVCQNIEQNVIFMHTYQKPKKLLQTLRATQNPPVLIFVSSISTVDEVVELLKEEEFFVEGLHSKKGQDERFKVICDFRNGTFDVLVATDLASRGLDIPELTHVINYDTPNSIEDYIHRCGRTGRFGRPGRATTFLTLDCKIADDLKQLMESSGIPIPKALEDSKQFGKKVLKTEFGDRIL